MKEYFKKIFHDKRFYVYSLIIIFSVAWTSVPLFTVRPLGLDVAIFLMLSLQFATAVLAYFLYLKESGDFNFEINGSENLKYFFCAGLVIILLQVFFYIITKNSDAETAGEFTIATIIALTIIVPIYEEIYYRGCALGLVRIIYKKGDVVPIVISSCFFCAMHTQYNDTYSYIVLFFSSLLIGFVRVKSKGLLLPVLLHSLMNITALLMMVNS
ncbi:CPBP family intramembrane glutamic endopeptidase [Cronobacter sp. JZ38]|uniref:CPBP family intramembrane glutamic endopeptidase n=1 Tax=Cronobacter sp. JZ38 TaxID=1906275 RepID=UPI0012A0159A|nr:CPBP family intramembrane glutamic endopeptidase [Cronobacter sp. JZ38]